MIVQLIIEKAHPRNNQPVIVHIQMTQQGNTLIPVVVSVTDTNNNPISDYLPLPKTFINALNSLKWAVNNEPRPNPNEISIINQLQIPDMHGN